MVKFFQVRLMVSAYLGLLTKNSMFDTTAGSTSSNMLILRTNTVFHSIHVK